MLLISIVNLNIDMDYFKGFESYQTTRHNAVELVRKADVHIAHL